MRTTEVLQSLRVAPSKATVSFVEDVVAAMEKHGVSLLVDDQYDGEERYCGKSVTFATSPHEEDAAKTVYIEAEDLAFAARVIVSS